jgi:hypothetical protein
MRPLVPHHEIPQASGRRVFRSLARRIRSLGSIAAIRLLLALDALVDLFPIDRKSVV